MQGLKTEIRRALLIPLYINVSNLSWQKEYK